MNLEGYRDAYSFYKYSCIIHMLAIEFHKKQKDKLGYPRRKAPPLGMGSTDARYCRGRRDNY